MGSSVVQNPSILSEPIDIEVAQSNVHSGKILQERNEAWICNEDCVYIINASNGLINQEWKCTYGKIYYITEVACDIYHFLVVAARVSSETTTSVIIVLNISSLSVVKLIFFPDEVTCISTLAIEKESCDIPNLLGHFDGILALGSYGGRVYLIDLNISQSLNEGPVHHPMPIKLVDDEVIQETTCGEHSALLIFQGTEIIHKSNMVDFYVLLLL